MEKYIYRGESKRDFFLVFSMGASYFEMSDDLNEDDFFVEEPIGVVIVPKDYDDVWIASYKFYLGWKVEVAQVGKEGIEGFSDGHWSMVKEGEIDGRGYVIYEDPEGKIVADTLGGLADIADSLEEYKRLSDEKLESAIYRAEMSRGR